MTLVAHLTSFDTPALFLAFAAGVTCGVAVVAALVARRGR